MWKASAGQSVKLAPSDEVDDWETDPDFEVPPPPPPFPVPAFSSFLVVTNEPSDLSRMTCRRRSSAGGPRRWRGQDTRNTSSEEQIDSVRLVLDGSSCVLVCILVQHPPAPPDGVHGAHVPEAAGDGHHAQSLVWLRRQVWTSGGPHGQGEETPPPPPS